jgi:hypothetical protein
MSPPDPEVVGDGPSANGTLVPGSRIDAAWRHLAQAVISEAQLLAIAVIADAAAAARARIARADSDGTPLRPRPAGAVTLGAAIGIVGAALLTPRVAHDRG